MKYILFLSVWLGLVSLTRFSTSAYKTSTLTGVVKDEYGEGMIGGTVKALQGSEIVRGAITDVEGKYIMTLDPGIYTIECSYTGYKTSLISVAVEKDEIKTLDVMLEPGVSEIPVIYYKVPPIDQRGCGIIIRVLKAGQPLPMIEIKPVKSSSVSKNRAKEAAKLNNLKKGGSQTRKRKRHGL